MVSDGRVVVVVTSNERRFFRLVSQEDGLSANKRVLTLEDEAGGQGVLSVVLSGGCSCGKPWLKKPSDAELLLKANQKFPTGEKVDV